MMRDYLVVLATALLGFAHAPWWSAVPGALLLTAFLVVNQQKLRPRLSAVMSADLLTLTGLASLPIGIAGSGAAFALGRVTAWIFGF